MKEDETVGLYRIMYERDGELVESAFRNGIGVLWLNRNHVEGFKKILPGYVFVEVQPDEVEMLEE